jgi:hypothetical protein
MWITFFYLWITGIAGPNTATVSQIESTAWVTTTNTEIRVNFQ